MVQIQAFLAANPATRICKTLGVCPPSLSAMADPARDSGERLTTTVEALHRHHEEFRVNELERARRSLAAGMPEERVLEELARRLTNKFLHAPMQALSQAAASERERLTPLLLRVFRPQTDQVSGRDNRDQRTVSKSAVKT